MLDNQSITDNRYNKTDYGMERSENTAISVSPLVADLYEEATTEDAVGLILKKEMYEMLYEKFLESPWYEKYGGNTKKVDKNDLQDVYYYFKPILIEEGHYNEVETFCAIAEFFGLSEVSDYKRLFNDVLSIEGKVKILEILKENYGLSKQLGRVNRLV